MQGKQGASLGAEQREQTNMAAFHSTMEIIDYKPNMICFSLIVKSTGDGESFAHCLLRVQSIIYGLKAQLKVWNVSN